MPTTMWCRPISAGSVRRDGNEAAAQSSFADHLNGNALYALGDPAFGDYLALYGPPPRDPPQWAAVALTCGGPVPSFVAPPVPQR